MLLATLLTAATAAFAAPSAPTQGVNDWNCKSAPGLEPVVFLHGLGAPAGLNWFTKAPIIASTGRCVYTPQYGTVGGVFLGWKSIRESSKEVSAFVDKVRASTGSDKVSLVGHSMGTTVSAYYMKFDGGAAKVKHFIGFAGCYKGTTFNGLDELIKTIPGINDVLRATCASCAELVTASPLMQELNAGGVAQPGPTFTNIVSKFDQTVLPYTSGTLDEPGVRNFVLQDRCTDLAGHLSQAVDPNVTNLILWALRGGQDKLPACLLWLIPGRRDVEARTIGAVDAEGPVERAVLGEVESTARRAIVRAEKAMAERVLAERMVSAA